MQGTVLLRWFISSPRVSFPFSYFLSVFLLVRFSLILEEKSTIYAIEVELYDPIKKVSRKLKAKIEEKSKAQEKYEEAISSGHTAMVAEKSVDEAISLYLGNIAAKMVVRARSD